jgi:hypothetical protein
MMLKQPKEEAIMLLYTVGMEFSLYKSHLR